MSSDEERMEEGVEGSSSGEEEGVGGRGVSHLGGWETEAMLTGFGTGTSAWCLPLGRRSGDKSRDWQFPAVTWGKRIDGRRNAQPSPVLLGEGGSRPEALAAQHPLF